MLKEMPKLFFFLFSEPRQYLVPVIKKQCIVYVSKSIIKPFVHVFVISLNDRVFYLFEINNT